MKTVVIPAAGLASRMKPLSRGVSKSMVTINGRPIISYILETIFKNPAVNEVVIVENELGDISEFVKRVYPERPIKFVLQEEKLGPLHAIYLGYQAIENEKNSITVWLGDTICLDSFPYHLDFVAVSRVDDPHRWCLIDTNGKLYDKPNDAVPTDRALVGVYNFNSRKTFDESIEWGMSDPTHKGEHQIAALLKYYQEQKGPMALIESADWYDCGELNTFYESKARLLSRSARSFNMIDVDTFYATVTKSSDDPQKSAKIEAEKQWFLSLDEEQSLFCPRILKSDSGVLKMTLEPGTALNEVLVYDNLRTDIWHEIIRKILKVHHEVFYTYNDNTADWETAAKHCFEHYYIKTKHRITEISNCVPIRRAETKFLTDTALKLSAHAHWSQVMHGDSHLGNIIYDPHSGNIKFVDPRGIFGETWTQGDMRYDMGKLLQDFYCGYAMIMANRYKYDADKETVTIDWVPGTENLSTFLENELKIRGYDVDLLKRLAVLLLITAIPFHADDKKRQMAMFARGKQLIQELTINN